jgi:type I restriction enzyme S subunit
MEIERTLEQVLTEAKNWLPAQDVFQRCGIGDGASTEEIERLYSELRDLDLAGKLETEAVNDDQGRKIYDRIRLKAV